MRRAHVEHQIPSKPRMPTMKRLTSVPAMSFPESLELFQPTSRPAWLMSFAAWIGEFSKPRLHQVNRWHDSDGALRGL
jgi:hypothetical protein